jgi:uncharacterized protein YndB with AHSA1/START domain
VVAAPPATVFAFLTDPEKILRWIGTETTLDPHPGGLFTSSTSAQKHGRGGVYRGHTRPPPRLSLLGGRGAKKVPPGSSLIEIDLIDQKGGTLVRLTHSGLPDAEECASHRQGWTHYLERLAVAAAGGDPGPDLPP